MSKKNDIRLSKRENHKVPNSEARGWLKALKKQEKIERGSIWDDRQFVTYVNWIFRIALGYIACSLANGFNNPATYYWVVYLFALVTLDSYKKEK